MSKDKDREFIWVALVVTVLIIGLWLLTLYLLKDESDRGTFGDMFGSVNALFSGLALAGIILTILLQRKELKLQREELRDTRFEFEKQNETLRLQRFENTFFNMISIHLEMIQSLSSINFNSKGREMFNAILHPWATELYNSRIQDYIDDYFTKYQDTFRRSVKPEILSHYLQSLQSIYNHVLTSKLIKEEEKENYFVIIKSYLSYPERRFLFYFLILGATNDSVVETLRAMEKDLMFIGTVSRDDLLKPSHLKLLDKFNF